MTIEEIKKIDKRLSEISYPFSVGLPAVKKIIEETAKKYQISESNVLRQYMGWKWYRDN